MTYPNGKAFICSAAVKDGWGDACHGRKLLASPVPTLEPLLTAFNENSAKIEISSFIIRRSFCVFCFFSALPSIVTLTLTFEVKNWTYDSDDLSCLQFHHYLSDRCDEFRHVTVYYSTVFHWQHSWKICCWNLRSTIVWTYHLDLYVIHSENFEVNKLIEVTVMMMHQRLSFHGLQSNERIKTV